MPGKPSNKYFFYYLGDKNQIVSQRFASLTIFNASIGSRNLIPGFFFLKPVVTILKCLVKEAVKLARPIPIE